LVTRRAKPNDVQRLAVVLVVGFYPAPPTALGALVWLCQFVFANVVPDTHIRRVALGAIGAAMVVRVCQYSLWSLAALSVVGPDLLDIAPAVLMDFGPDTRFARYA